MKFSVCFLFCIFFSQLSYTQTKLTRDSFYVSQSKFPSNYKTIIGDPNGWRTIGYYNISKEKVDPKLLHMDTLSNFTPFKSGKMFSKIRGNKIVGRGDKRSVTKIIYVDSSILILENSWTERYQGQRRKTKYRTLYRRRTYQHI